MERKSGVLLHVSSLWGDYSCGAFGKEGREFVDFLSDAGFSYWQVLPFCLPDGVSSPYKSYSAFSVNADLIDLKELRDAGLITPLELEEARQNTPYVCEFDRLKAERFELLKKAAARFRGDKTYDEFFKTHAHTEKFCHFMAIRAKNDDKVFQEWTSDEEDAEVLQTWKFICYTFVRQWKALKKYANDKGVLIIGDIPIYVAPDSSDVWESPDQFLVDYRGRPTRVAGVPPDYFSKDGQLWGNPLYNWKVMKADGFKWWRDRISFMCEFFDCIRIDHFRGLESFYTCAPDATNAINGKWMKGPGIKFVNVLKEVCGDKMLIAEDLGIITPAVKKLVDKSGLPGMRVLQFGFTDDAESPHLPHNYIKNCIAYTGTHDNDTLLGYVWNLDDASRRRVLSYCGFSGDHWDCREAYLSVIRTMMCSVADTVIFPLQDLLMYGSDTRMNTPGVPLGNWAWRVTKEQLDGIDRSYFRYLNELFGRYKSK
ncbi:MAG: 4-alpha-glucanotransferase [Clostridia bacterium]|nr:4-alpha-glucanotransferase [Clostridia bacterium]